MTPEYLAAQMLLEAQILLDEMPVTDRMRDRVQVLKCTVDAMHDAADQIMEGEL